MTWGPTDIIEDPRRHNILKNTVEIIHQEEIQIALCKPRGQHESNLRTRRINKESRFQDKSKYLNDRERHNAQINKNHIHRLTNSRRFSKKNINSNRSVDVEKN